MSVRIKYAYLKQQTWLYRRNYPKELQPVLGQAMKQSLKTGDARIAKARAAEVNARYEEVLAKARAGQVIEKPALVVVTLPVFAPVVIVGRRTVRELARDYLNRRSRELRHGGFKLVRFSVGLFVSAYGTRPIGTVAREDAVAFVRKLALLGRHVGKSCRTRGYGLDQLVEASTGETIAARTQRRTVSQVSHFLDWAVYEGSLPPIPSEPSGLRRETRAAATRS